MVYLVFGSFPLFVMSPEQGQGCGFWFTYGGEATTNLFRIKGFGVQKLSNNPKMKFFVLTEMCFELITEFCSQIKCCTLPAPGEIRYALGISKKLVRENES